MLQPLYVFTIFVLRRNVINVSWGVTKTVRQKISKNQDNPFYHKKSIIKNRQTKDSDYSNNSNPTFGITVNKDTDCIVVLMSSQPRKEIPLTSYLPGDTRY